MTTAPPVPTGFTEGSDDPLLPHGGDNHRAGDQETAHALSDRKASWLEETLLIENLPALSPRRLRSMSNRLYRLLDADFPPAGALERYQAITEELALRTGKTQDPRTGSPLRFSLSALGPVPGK